MCMENDVGRLFLFHDMLCFWLAVTNFCFARAHKKKEKRKKRGKIMSRFCSFLIFNQSFFSSIFCSMVPVVDTVTVTQEMIVVTKLVHIADD